MGTIYGPIEATTPDERGKSRVTTVVAEQKERAWAGAPPATSAATTTCKPMEGNYNSVNRRLLPTLYSLLALYYTNTTYYA